MKFFPYPVSAWQTATKKTRRDAEESFDASEETATIAFDPIATAGIDDASRGTIAIAVDDATTIAARDAADATDRPRTNERSTTGRRL